MPSGTDHTGVPRSPTPAFRAQVLGPADSLEKHLATGSAAPGTDENPLVQPEGGRHKAGGGQAASTEEKQGLLSGSSHAHQA